ncbi:MAG TPA: N-acetylmuramoyl-L-alanine amidase-like domain-containing protein, partial [Longimicrobiales bacterium]|nr:N-acetylmuramoyl-L-alanine amidase-like domain-containing protein [Longimicrobiales bacterium]
SDWIADAETKGLVTDVTAELGSVPDPGAVDFMTTHAEAYRQLADPHNAEAVRAAEVRLTERGRRYVPQDRLDAVAPSIRDGDIIAATSTVPGLDVAHTGLALWVDGTLRLLHAPLVGDSVQISEESLPRRIRRIVGQDGIMVARPLSLQGPADGR